MILLTNALYFEGPWFSPFNGPDTRNRKFYVNGETETEIPTMSVEGIFQYGEYPEVNAIFVQLPYQLNLFPVRTLSVLSVFRRPFLL